MAGRRMGALLKLLNLTAPPAAPTAGDLWFRSDLGQVRGSDGLSGEQLTIGPTGNVPTVRTTAWHNVPAYGNAASANVPDGRLFAMPEGEGAYILLTYTAMLALRKTLAERGAVTAFWEQ